MQTVTDKIIYLIKIDNTWMARFVNDFEVIKLFGTDTIPTPFNQYAPAEMVKIKIEKLNPGYRVEIFV